MISDEYYSTSQETRRHKRGTGRRAWATTALLMSGLAPSPSPARNAPCRLLAPRPLMLRRLLCPICTASRYSSSLSRLHSPWSMTAAASPQRGWRLLWHKHTNTHYSRIARGSTCGGSGQLGGHQTRVFILSLTAPSSCSCRAATMDRKASSRFGNQLPTLGDLRRFPNLRIQEVRGLQSHSVFSTTRIWLIFSP